MSPITANKVVPAEYKRTIHCVTPEAGTVLADVMKPDYYRHVAQNFKPMDRLEVMPEDGDWYAELMVIFVSKNEVKVSKLSYSKLTAVSEEDIESGDHEVKWRGPSAKWSVVVTATGDVVKDGFDTKEEAASFLSEHTKALAA